MAKVFDRETKRFIETEEDKVERIENTRSDSLLYKELGFPTPYSSITYEEDLIFNKKADRIYTQDSLEAVKSIIKKEMELLSIGSIQNNIIFDLDISADVLQVAYLMLRYVAERGYSVSKLLTSYECQKNILSYSSYSNWEENFETDLAIILIQGGTPVSYVQTVYEERMLRGKKTIMFLMNKSLIKGVLRDLAKTTASPNKATYVGVVNKQDVDFYSELSKDVLEQSKQDFNELVGQEYIGYTAQQKETKPKQTGSLDTSIFSGTSYTS